MGPRYYRLGLLGVAAVGAADGVSKAIATASLQPHSPAWLIPSVLGAERVMHAEGLARRDIALAALVTAVVVATVVAGVAQLPARQRSATALLTGMALGGILANAAERLVHGSVTDWILVHLPGLNNLVGNLADVAIIAGGIPVIVMTLLGLLHLAAEPRVTE